jgi:hypothetical protein
MPTANQLLIFLAHDPATIVNLGAHFLSATVMEFLAPSTGLD